MTSASSETNLIQYKTAMGMEIYPKQIQYYLKLQWKEKSIRNKSNTFSNSIFGTVDIIVINNMNIINIWHHQSIRPQTTPNCLHVCVKFIANPALIYLSQEFCCKQIGANFVAFIHDPCHHRRRPLLSYLLFVASPSGAITYGCHKSCGLCTVGCNISQLFCSIHNCTIRAR